MNEKMKKKLLVVDDTLINRRILSKILEADYTVLEAENGKVALDILEKEKNRIAAVLLDIVMPVMNGYAFLDALRVRPWLAGIPILVTTQNEGEDAEIKALSSGAADFLTKPYKPEIIKHRLANLIKLRETAALINVIERDTLTGLYNKSRFYLKAEECLKAAHEGALNLIALDIEHFKLVNDIYNISEGDKLLKKLSALINTITQRVAGISARMVNDKFMILYPRLPGATEQITTYITEGLQGYPLDIKITVKFGVYEIDDTTTPIEMMCDRAILAVKKVKGLYGEDCAYYDDSIRKGLLMEQQITDEMNQALLDGQFQVYLQPKYDLDSERIAGAEALVRWIHPERGVISPGDFIPLFEKNGFITTLDMYIWEKTCGIISRWIYGKNKYVPVSVNVSRSDIYNPHLPEILSKMVKKYGLKPKHLHLEITETAYTENPQQLIEVVGKLKNLGFVVEMDDFGSGYSSLNMLSELPIDVLKLDMKFIQNETQKNGSRNILSFIISLAKWMDLLVVAEGVETREQVNMLRNMNCNYVQGFYYSKPMHHRDFTDLLMRSPICAIQEDGTIPEEGTVTVNKSLGHTGNEKIMMIIDDIALNRAILSEFFTEIYTVVEADNGKVAYEYIKNHYKDIAIIMLDLVMPVMDGFQLLEILQKNPLLKTIPVIVTSQAGEMNEARVLEMGASDFIVKPYNMDIAVRRVHNVMADTRVQSLEREKELMVKMQRIEQEAKTDQMTGLYNRTEFESQINTFFRNRREKKATFIILDIDDFKTVNDNLGHLKGDDAIRYVADTLKGCFRQNDIISRMGGDEFAIFVKTYFSAEDIERRLNDLCEKLKFFVENMVVTCSLGACIAPDYGSDYETLYQNADIALLTAKRLGKSQYKVFGGENALPSNVLFRNMDWLLDEASDGVLVSDSEDYTVYYINDVACYMAGKTKKECMGKKCYEVMWNRSSPCDHCVHIDRLTKDYCEHEASLEGTDRSFLIKGKLIEWGGRQARIQYIQDNTEHKKAEKKMIENARALRTAIEQNNAFFWEYDLHTDSCSNGFRSVEELGMPEEMEDYPECIIKNGFIHPESVEEFREMHQKLKAGAPYLEMLAKVSDNDGVFSWKKIRYTTFFDAKGNPMKAFGSSESVDFFMKLKQRYTLIIEEFNLQTFVLDIPNREIINEMGVQLKLGYPEVIKDVPESLIAEGLIHPEDIPKLRDIYDCIYNGEERVSGITRWKTDANSKWYTTQVVLSRFKDGGASKVRAFGTSRILNE